MKPTPPPGCQDEGLLAQKARGVRDAPNNCRRFVRSFTPSVKAKVKVVAASYCGTGTEGMYHIWWQWFCWTTAVKREATRSPAENWLKIRQESRKTKVKGQRQDKDEEKEAAALTIWYCISSRNSDFVNLTISVVLFYVVISLTFLHY